MKKFTILAIAALAISFASCKKDRTCTCTTTYASGGGTHTEVTVYKKAKKHDVRGMCVGESGTDTYSPGSSSTKDTKVCDLK